MLDAAQMSPVCRLQGDQAVEAVAGDASGARASSQARRAISPVTATITSAFSGWRKPRAGTLPPDPGEDHLQDAEEDEPAGHLSF